MRRDFSAAIAAALLCLLTPAHSDRAFAGDGGHGASQRAARYCTQACACAGAACSHRHRRSLPPQAPLVPSMPMMAFPMMAVPVMASPMVAAPVASQPVLPASALNVPYSPLGCGSSGSPLAGSPLRGLGGLSGEDLRTLAGLVDTLDRPAAAPKSGGCDATANNLLRIPSPPDEDLEGRITAIESRLFSMESELKQCAQNMEKLLSKLEGKPNP